ncbi:ImmA/IrrE family metallo-endopeptidase [Streptomyces platensis]|uniref:ImmA/IrrE family metallo-endopeptidase n=1 Tax=Streptomyces platensis TaxID=58346 RepID=UPI002E11453C|nr:ImmA/IrrE family metallo-endopeptidase [Streptomyces platensis]WSI60069.1 ImmA/IrrE family metallo-endopeptidase [Streptomyces platensis]
MNWAVAHRIAGIAAAQAHRDLGIDRTRYVHVYQALKSAEIVAMAKPMPRLFGIYFSPRDKGPAVLLNANLDVVTQRHTAAHELGHHCLRHSTAADEELHSSLRWGNGQWPEEEKTAEAFAAWFLMPRPAVLAGLERICHEGRPTSPEHAYQLARFLGTSYAGTVRHLQHLRLLEAGVASQWAKISPAALRSSLAGGATLPADAHVHVITPGTHLQQVHADAGDVLVVRIEGAGFVSLPKGLARWTGTTYAADEIEAAVVTDEFHGATLLEVSAASQGEPVRLTVSRDSPRVGVDDVWPD